MNNKVFKFFEKISEIPRGSSNTDRISNYLVEFANDRQLKCIQDEVGNVIIWKNGSVGRENEDAVIIQGHMDMVTEKTEESSHDFTSDGLELIYEGDYLYAKDTTLGGDDGIAVAYALALLDDNSLSHPPIEAVFTVDEEIGMLGAAALDMSVLKGKYLLNVDSEDESSILVSCAGGMTSICNIELTSEIQHGTKYKITVNGLKGGHSGTEIDKERANAVKEMGRVLDYLNKKTDIYVMQINGGLKDNAIPRECNAIVISNNDDEISNVIASLNENIKKEYQTSDENVCVSIEKYDTNDYNVLDEESTNKVIMFINVVPNGICNMSQEIDGLVETSLNLGIFNVDINNLCAKFSVRSSVASRKEYLGEKLKSITTFLGGTYSVQGNYPAWEYKKDSRLRELMVDIYSRMYKKELKVEAIHAGLECGYFMAAMPQLDVVSFGPDIFDIHTTEEKMSISSVKRIYEYIIEILKEI